MSAEPLPLFNPLGSGTSRLTTVYATTAAGLDLLVDVQLPYDHCLKPGAKLPVLISYHGGGMSEDRRHQTEQY